MKTKYIITQIGDAITFAPIISHNAFKAFKPIAAGFVDIYYGVGQGDFDKELKLRCECSGESESLKLKSRGEEDEDIINIQILNNYKMEDFKSILNRKIEHYGCFSKAVIEFSAEEYATRKMIDENLSMLKMAKLHMDTRACIVLENRISELEAMIRLAV